MLSPKIRKRWTYSWIFLGSVDLYVPESAVDDFYFDNSQLRHRKLDHPKQITTDILSEDPEACIDAPRIRSHPRKQMVTYS